MRIALTPDGTPVMGRTLPGRGAWLCAGSLTCLRQAAKRNALSRALRAPVSPEVILPLSKDLAG
ncbi:MAG: YlxR family protein [Acidimicrobiales bacterium]